MLTKRLLIPLAALCLLTLLPSLSFAQQNNGNGGFRDDDSQKQPPPPPAGSPPPPPAGEPPPPPAGSPPPPHHGQPPAAYPPPPHHGGHAPMPRRIRLPRPILNLRIAGYTGLSDNEFLSFYGFSAELRALHPLVGEIGFEANSFAISAFARLGVSFFLSRIRSLQTGAGQEITFSAYGGYRFMRMESLGIDLYQGISLYAGADYYFWLTHHFGFNFHIGGGGGMWIASTNSNHPLFFPEVRVAFGLAF
jgi:hypothetical protein